MNNQTRNRPRKSRKQHVKNGRNNKRGGSLNSYRREFRLPKRIPFDPSSALVTLKFTWNTWLNGNSGNYVWGKAFRMNGVFDPDPVLGGGSYTGFASYATRYQYYLAIEFRSKVICCNEMDTAMKFAVAPMAQDVGANYVNAAEVAELRLGQGKMLSGKGGMDRSTIYHKIDLPRYSGNEKAYMSDDNFKALVTFNPVDMFWLYIAAASYNAQSAAAFGLDVYFEVDVLFTEPAVILDTYASLIANSVAPTETIKVLPDSHPSPSPLTQFESKQMEIAQLTTRLKELTC